MKFTLLIVLFLFSSSFWAQDEEDLKNKNEDKIADIRKKIEALEISEANSSLGESDLSLKDSIVLLNEKIDSMLLAKTNNSSKVSTFTKDKQQVVEFEYNSSVLSLKTKERINTFFDQLPKDYNAISIHGHADNGGSETMCIRYSRMRAEKVKDYLINIKNVPSSKVLISWHGSSIPTGNGSDRRCELNYF